MNIYYFIDILSLGNDFATIFGLLRLDPKYVSFAKSDKLKVLDAEKLVSHALTFDVSDVDFNKLRPELFDKHLKVTMRVYSPVTNKKKRSVWKELNNFLRTTMTTTKLCFLTYVDCSFFTDYFQRRKMKMRNPS